MTSQDKKVIYELLRKASDAYYEYASKEFKDEVFCEDTQHESTNNESMENSLENPVTVSNTTEEEVTEPLIASPEESQEDPIIIFQNLKNTLDSCHNCKLCTTRTNTVLGEGVMTPSVLVIGEAPGEEEDLQGRPFVGPAGALLDKMLNAISLDRNINCYIANIVKCRPPLNRNPSPEEAYYCRAYLEEQIKILKPKMILLMGRVAAQNLLSSKEALGHLRGKFFSYKDIPVFATYHPSALLRDATLKRPAWEDLKLFRQRLLEIDSLYAKDFNTQK